MRPRGGVPGLTAADIVVEDVTVPMGAGPAPPCKRVTVRFTHTYMFIPGIGAWFGGTYNTCPCAPYRRCAPKVLALRTIEGDRR